MRSSLVLPLCAAALLSFNSFAEHPLPDPYEGGLRIEGAIEQPSGARRLDLTIAALEALPQHTLLTRVPWSKERHSYSGPLLRDVLKLAEARGSTLNALALNDYKVAIPVEDAYRYDVIIATRIDGESIPVRKLGPLLVMYPFDAHPALKDKRFYARAIWQLKSLVVQ